MTNDERLRMTSDEQDDVEHAVGVLMGSASARCRVAARSLMRLLGRHGVPGYATNHDAAPAARANAESVAPQPTACDRSQPVKDAESDRSKPINDDRLAALEELSALDQKLELEYGVTGNPMIKARQRTPPHATHPQGSVQDKGSFRDSRNANAAAKEGGTVTPLYAQPHPALTDAEREAIRLGQRLLREAYAARPNSDFVAAAAVIDGLLARLGGRE